MKNQNQKKTKKQFVEEIKFKHPNLKVIGKYVDNGTKIFVQDELGIKYMVYPGNLLKGKTPIIKSAIDKTVAFKMLLKLKQPNLTVLGEYEHNKKKILIKDQDEIEYMMLPSKLLFGDVPSIQSAINKNLAFQIKAEQVHGTTKYDYSLSKYKFNKQKIKITCKKCNITFTQTPGNHLSGQGCPQCKIKNMQIRGYIKTVKRSETINKDIIKIHENRIGLNKFIFKGAHIKSKFKCNTNRNHGYWMATPSNILAGKGCPNCKVSKGEIKVESFLKNNRIKYVREHKFNDCKNERNLRFDFYLPGYNACIEFDGETTLC